MLISVLTTTWVCRAVISPAVSSSAGSLGSLGSLRDETGEAAREGGDAGGVVVGKASLDARREMGRCTAMLTPVPRMRP
jgi:hypothetical protein